MKTLSRKKTGIIFLLLSISIFYLFTWGLVIEAGHEFTSVPSENSDCNAPDSTEEDRTFTPEHLWIEYSSVKIPVVLIVNSVRWQSLPCDISLYKSDPTYRKTHKKYKKFIIEKFEVLYADGTKKVILNKDTPLAERTFEICSDYSCNTVTFQKVITKKLNLAVSISGVALKENGEATPFHFKNNYKYSRYFRVQSFLNKIGSI